MTSTRANSPRRIRPEEDATNDDFYEVELKQANSSAATEPDEEDSNGKSYDEERGKPDVDTHNELLKVARGTKNSSCFCFGSCTRGRILWALALLLVILAAVVALSLLIPGGNSFFIGFDPPGVSEANRWNTRGQGTLSLYVINSLEDRYTPMFDRYIQEWDNGTPDVLNLSTGKSDHDPECGTYQGRMNVCNSNYGKTGWRGLNTIILRNGFIQSSVAKLNDFHLDRESEATSLYVMCHEIGHGFGLPHTDENYYNIPRGDCMDYTLWPSANLDPGQFNFDVLFEIYGLPPETTAATRARAYNQGSTNGSTSNNNEGEDEKEKEDDRMLEEIPEDTMNKYYLALADIEAGSCEDSTPTHGARLLKKNSHAEACTVDLGAGYSMEVHKLLVPP